MGSLLPTPAPGEFSRAQGTGTAPSGAGGRSAEQPNSNKVFQLNEPILHAAKSCYYYLQMREQRRSILDKVTQLLCNRVGT